MFVVEQLSDRFPLVYCHRIVPLEHVSANTDALNCYWYPFPSIVFSRHWRALFRRSVSSAILFSLTEIFGIMCFKETSSLQNMHTFLIIIKIPGNFSKYFFPKIIFPKFLSKNFFQQISENILKNFPKNFSIHFQNICSKFLWKNY